MHFKVVPLGLGCHLVAVRWQWPFLIGRACNLQVDLHSLPSPPHTPTPVQVGLTDPSGIYTA